MISITDTVAGLFELGGRIVRLMDDCLPSAASHHDLSNDQPNGGEGDTEGGMDILNGHNTGLVLKNMERKARTVPWPESPHEWRHLAIFYNAPFPAPYCYRQGMKTIRKENSLATTYCPTRKLYCWQLARPKEKK